MRRSSAPSAVANKRARFMPPLKRHSTDSPQEIKKREPSDILKLMTKAVGQTDDVSMPCNVQQAETHACSEGSIDTCANAKRDHTDDSVLQSTHTSTPNATSVSSLQLQASKNPAGTLGSAGNSRSLGMHRSVPSHARSMQQNDSNTFRSITNKPGYNKPASTGSTATSVLGTSTAENVMPGDSETRYFNVMWCKLSKKKHKKWEGDAILIVKGRTTRLVDLDGKEIGTSSGYKRADLASLGEGETLPVGGKEIEIMSTMNEGDYLSGKCFNNSTSKMADNSNADDNSAPNPVSKKFRNPLKSSSTSVGLRAQVVYSNKPRYDPSDPDALVMPRPSMSHQYSHNAGRAPVIDIVIDPHLCRHLRPHQKAGVSFMYKCVTGMNEHGGRGVILADEMGLGKTLQAITLIWTLLKQGMYGGVAEVKRVIIITPGSLVKNWHKEFKKWLGVERLQVYAVGNDNKVQDYVACPKHCVLIISYEMFIRNTDALANIKFDLLVCDEGHRLKNVNIKTNTSLSSLNTRRRVILTGTPVQNDLHELYALVEFANPTILGSSTGFRNVYEHPIVTSRQPQATIAEQQLGHSRAQQLNQITESFILRRTQQTIAKYLPPKCICVLFCRSAPLQRSLYQRLVSSHAVTSCTSSLDPSHYLLCIGALKKLTNHPRLLTFTSDTSNTTEAEEGGEREGGGGATARLLSENMKAYLPPTLHTDPPLVDDSGKLQCVMALLDGFHKHNHRVVLVSHYTQTLDLLNEVCRSRGYVTSRLDGHTPTHKRQTLVDAFNSPYSNQFIFLLSSKAGGVGLNLIGASRLILYDIDWNPANDAQAMARIWRDGQKKKVFIYRLITTGTIEEKIYQRQVMKQGLSAAVVDSKYTCTKGGSSSHDQKFSQQDLKDLFTFHEGTDCNTHDLLGCECLSLSESQSKNEQLVQDESEESVKTKASLTLAKSFTSPSCVTKEDSAKMDELLSWKHTPAVDLHTALHDPALGESTFDTVTFTFTSETTYTQDTTNSA